MRMDPQSGMSCRSVARAGQIERELSRVIHELGEERFARRIARAIVAHRRESPITRTAGLAAIVAAAVPTREPRQASRHANLPGDPHAHQCRAGFAFPGLAGKPENC